MSHINNTKQITMVQTTSQTNSVIKTKILIILDGFLKVWLIIINNILVIVSRITHTQKITFVKDSLSHNGVTIGFLNFLQLPPTL